MDKMKAKKVLCSAAAKQGLKVQMRAGKTADDIRILNASTGKVVAEGTIALDASKAGYTVADVRKTVNQINTKLAKDNNKNLNASKRKMNSARGKTTFVGKVTLYNDFADFAPEVAEKLIRSRLDNLVPNGDIKFNHLNDTEIEVTISCPDADKNAAKVAVESSDVTKYVDWGEEINAGCHGKKKMNAAEEEAYTGDDVDFVEDVESVVLDEQGNEVSIDEMLVVQDSETNEIALFIPTEEDEALPENVEVIGEVTAADDTVLDSSRRVKMKASRRK